MTHHKTAETALVKNGREEETTTALVTASMEHFTAAEMAKAFLSQGEKIATALEEERVELKSRLAEIEALQKRLPSPASAEDAAPRTPRLRHGSLPGKVMEILARNPHGMTGSEIQEAMHEPSGRIYPMLYRYAKEGVIRAEGPKGRQVYKLAAGKPVRGRH